MNTLRLNLKIYPFNYIKKAIEDYSQYVEILIKNKFEKHIEIGFYCNENDFVIIKKEFCNYLIYLIGREV